MDGLKGFDWLVLYSLWRVQVARPAKLIFWLKVQNYPSC